MRFAAHVVLAAALVAPLPSAMAPAATRPVHERFVAPVGVTNAGDGTDRLFVVERRGVIRATHEGGLSTAFLDLRSSVQDGGERGLLGLAFHPRFKTNRHLFVFYTRNGGDIVVARYTADASRTRVDPATARPVLLIEHSERSNHNGGGLAFGPDGYLYVAVGDGGGAGDPEGDARSITRNFLGKILRIDIDRTGSGTYGRYGIPSSNPFAGATPGRGEIWAYGLRNPWRISFDRSSGALYIGDVGQGSREEIDRQSAGAPGGRDYGWNVMEGTTCYRPSACPLAGDTLPIAEYTHAGGNCSITGGYVYRGTAIPSLVGHYIFGDYCTGRIWSLRPGGRSADITLRRDTPYQITSFGEHEDGELYFVTIDGRLERFRLG